MDCEVAVPLHHGFWVHKRHFVGHNANESLARMVFVVELVQGQRGALVDPDFADVLFQPAI